jgi:glycosyltransferase involved in cell wall biosynthesis
MIKINLNNREEKYFMKNKVKVLHIITGLPIGGAEKVLLDLSTHLNKDIITPFVIGLNNEVDLIEDFRKQNIWVKPLNMKKNPKGFFYAMKEINSIIKDKQIDIIHAHMFHPLVFAYTVKKANPNIKIVFTSHNENIGSHSRELFTHSLKKFRDVDIVFSKEMITNMYKDNSIVIPNGIDIDAFKQEVEKEEKFTFLSVGVLREQKNQPFLAECAKILKDRGYTNFQINIVGAGDASGDLSESIKASIKEHGVEEYVNMLGSRRDIPILLKKSHCFVMPSLFEGLPISILEAGAASLPIIATPVGAIPSVIDKNSGYLATLENFADVMEEVLREYDRATKKAEIFLKEIELNYSIDNMALSHEKIYTQLLENINIT